MENIIMEKYIVFNPKILGGKPTIRGTRITVDFILELFASGMREEEIIREYPQLTKAALRVALEYAARSIKHEEVVFTR